MEKNYFVGLDMGTSSVGWAVTDENYNLIRKKGKDLWGIREFEPANTAQERRANRISRRRRQRELIRLGLVKDYFADAIATVDSSFYQRLENSKYYLEDKDEDVRTSNGIFNDKEYKDKDYYKEYPTIYHLRKELIENKNKPYDVRLVYLAISNLFKRRGHFLNNSLNVDNGKFDVNIKEAYEELLNSISRAFSDDESESLTMPVINEDCVYKELEKILGNRDYSRKYKAEKIRDLLNIDKKAKKQNEVINGIVGLKIDCCKAFGITDSEEKIEAKFSEFGYSEKEPGILELLGDVLGEVLVNIKRIYDAGTLTELLKGYNYLSFARCSDYEKHKEDLRLLKMLVKKYQPEQFDSMFRDTHDGSYSAYVNSSNSEKYNYSENGIKKPNRRNMDKRSKADFYSTVKKMLSPFANEDERVQTILDEMENGTFMPKQLNGDNGVIPNQLHAIELKVILQNASEYLPFLNEIDGSGLSVAERIYKLFTFTLPYYIGPTTEKSKTGWVVRNKGYENTHVLPWNMNDVIDQEKTHKEFIERMVRRCTYMNNEQVLPKNSLLYEKFCVLNEINNIRIDNVRIDNNLKKTIYNELYKKGKKPTLKKLHDCLILNGISESAQITGIDREINNSLASYGKFAPIMGELLDTDDGRKVVEDIIYTFTIFGDDRKYLKEYLLNTYPENEYPYMTLSNIKRILGFKFSDWGRFSKELLMLEGYNRETGEIYTLLDALWEENYNFMELINSPVFSFKESMDKLEKNTLSSLAELDVEVLDRYYFSAPVKRMILQTNGVLKEIVKVMGGAPRKIFIEMTRSDEQKGDAGRTSSRKKQLLDLYKNVKQEVADRKYWSDLIEHESETGRIKSKKMYLYIKQMGCDMYTGEPIDLDELFTNRYDIDHIYPRHYVTDNNIENNLVLTNKASNEHIKKDYYPIPEKIRNNPATIELWDRLHANGMINDIKYARLRCKEEFSDEQKANFIARQLVETSQGTKGISDLLRQMLPTSELVFVKANNVSRFRQNKGRRHKNGDDSPVEGFSKSRLINDFHHANDAYLNIVVGNVYHTKFTSNPLNYIKKDYRQNKENFEYNLGRMFETKVVRNGYVAWIPEGNKENLEPTINTVNKVMSRNTPLYTRKAFVKPGIVNKVTIYGKRKATPERYMPLKSGDPKIADVTKYGGMTSISICYYFLVEHEVKGKRIRTIEGLPGYMHTRVENNPDELEKYCRDVLKLVNFSIRYRKIRIQSLLKVNGYRANLSGKTGDALILRNAEPLYLPDRYQDYIAYLEKHSEEEYHDKLDKEVNIQIYDILMEKFKDGIYRNRAKTVGNIMSNGRGQFIELSVEKQYFVINEILKLTTIGTLTAALGDIGGRSNNGKFTVGKKISDLDSCQLINTSYTGIFNSAPIDLKTV
mgnify:FL=1